MCICCYFQSVFLTFLLAVFTGAFVFLFIIILMQPEGLLQSVHICSFRPVLVYSSKTLNEIHIILLSVNYN